MLSKQVPQAVGWPQTISFFHAAFDSLLLNELQSLQLKDHRYGVDIEVPSATILSIFGFRASQIHADAGILLASSSPSSQHPCLRNSC
ncbi:hypothetical protein E5Q_01272 [Mixia osmundae IAM 14324]|uniref:Uncharacterized protein n=1 Tax=Mixia osmundae (strain CBS 9802 / IAM 14324 / JCM 22182 / KY 12970) TaxID=764103 RepID=G7DVL0_MIXOS|nr:hypothetical protein E5Q_01272 [Mixia osmundae IAM 14324]